MLPCRRFNINLLHLDKESEVENFFDVITGQNFTPLITSPTRITTKTKTLIDNIYYNDFTSNIISGNLTIGISDHMPQIALIPKVNAKTTTNPGPKQSSKYYRKYKNINVDALNHDLNQINWKINDLEDVNQYGNKFLNRFNQILDLHAPLIKGQHTNWNDKGNA